MRKNILFISLITIISVQIQAQGFSDIQTNLTGLHWGDVAWGDYDNDGDLDVITTGLDDDGTGQTFLYKNNGNDNFSPVSDLNIPGTFVGDVIWGDYDADGDLDILISGYTDAGQITKIYKNSGDDNFGDSNIPLAQLVDGSISFVDYNNDGYSDILLAGFDGEAYLCYLYENNGDGSYSDSECNLPGLIKCAYEWADYDQDGDMDVFATGLDGEGQLISKLFINSGSATFINSTNNFVGAWLGDMQWGDYDNDGDLDILLSGYTLSTERIAKVYQNQGDGNFSEILGTGLDGVSHSSTIWGDYDNDGDLDVFIAGTYEGGSGWIRVTDVFINNGDDTFSAANLSFTTDAYWGESAWGDYDSDGDLDLICSGYNDAGANHTIIYRNNSTTPNTAPQAPTNILSQVTNQEVMISWDMALDNETPSLGLSYNAYIRDEGSIIWNPNASAQGFLLMPQLGNVQENIQWTIQNLAIGQYYCAVQAIDHNYQGSAFSEEVAFEITTVNTNEITNQDKPTLYNIPNPVSTETQFIFNLQEAVYVEIEIIDLNGRTIKRLIQKNLSSGEQEINWDLKTNTGEKASPGVYYYHLLVNGISVEQAKLIIVEHL